MKFWIIWYFIGSWFTLLLHEHNPSFSLALKLHGYVFAFLLSGFFWMVFWLRPLEMKETKDEP